MKQIVEIREVSKFSFTDEKSGNLIEGITLQYEENVSNNPNKKGLERVIMKSSNMKLFEKIDLLPAKYEIICFLFSFTM
jgi:hypothetical protein